MRWLFTLLAIAACESGSANPEPSPHQPGPVAVDHSAGKATYTKYCAPCHGVDLKGYVADHAPSLINKTFQESANDQYLEHSIALGRPGTSMPAYSKQRGGPLDDALIDGMVGYIRSQGVLAITLSPVAKGESARGSAIYNEYCKTCHGDTTIRGEATHLANIQFQRTASDSFIRYAVEKGRPGTKMARAPFRGPVGEWIQTNISKETFDTWIAQGTKVIRCDVANTAGFSGAGITVGVLSDSYNLSPISFTSVRANNDIGSGDLSSPKLVMH